MTEKRDKADAPEQTSTVNPMRADRVPLDPLLDGVLQHGSDIGPVPNEQRARRPFVATVR